MLHHVPCRVNCAEEPCAALQGSNKYLRAMSIFAMLMVPFSQPSVRQRRVAPVRSSKVGIQAVYNRASRLLSAEIAPEMFDQVSEPRTALKDTSGPNAYGDL